MRRPVIEAFMKLDFGGEDKKIPDELTMRINTIVVAVTVKVMIAPFM